MQVYLLLALLFALLVAVFAVQNAITVDIQFLFWGIKKVPLSLVILASVAAGAVIVFVVGVFRQIRMSMQIRELTARLNESKPKTPEIKNLNDKPKPVSQEPEPAQGVPEGVGGQDQSGSARKTGNN